MKIYKNANSGDNQKVWGLVNDVNITTKSDWGLNAYNKVNNLLTILLDKVKNFLKIKIRKYESDRGKQSEMGTAMITDDDYQGYKEAADILIVLVRIKDAKKKVSSTIKKLEEYRDNTKKKGWAVLNRYRVNDKGFADDFLEVYEGFEEKKLDRKEVLENDYRDFFEEVADSTNESEIKTKIDERFKDILEEEEREKVKEDITPIIIIGNTLKASSEPEKQELGNLVAKSQVAFSYNSSESLKDPEKLEDLRKQLEELEKFTKSAGEKNSVFIVLNGNDQEEIKKLVSKVQARVAEMSKVQTIEPSKLSGVSTPVIFGIIALAVAVGGVIFYFLEGVYWKRSEEI